MLRLVVPAAVLLLMVSVGMGLDLSQLVGESRRLGAWAWLRLLLFTFVVPPAIALLLARLFGFGAGETPGCSWSARRRGPRCSRATSRARASTATWRRATRCGALS